MRRAALSTPQVISKEHFSEWKNHPVTERLFIDLCLGLVESFNDGIPEDLNSGPPKAFIRQGHQEMIKEIIDWNPTEVEDA